MSDMTDAEITALVERVVAEKLAERDRAAAERSRAMLDRMADGMTAALHRVEATITLDGKRLARLADNEHKRSERLHGPR